MKKLLSLFMSFLLVVTVFSTTLLSVNAATQNTYEDNISIDDLALKFNPSNTSTILKSDIDDIIYYLNNAQDIDETWAIRMRIAVEYLINSNESSIEYSATAPVYDTTEMSTVYNTKQNFRYNVDMKVLKVALETLGASNIYYGAIYQNRSANREELLSFEGNSKYTAEIKVKGKVSDFSITINRNNSELGLRTSVLPYVRFTDKNGKTHILYSDESVSKSPAGWLKSAIGICLSDKKSAAYVAYISRLTKMSEMDCYNGLDLGKLFLEIASTKNQVEALNVLKSYKAEADKDFYYQLIKDLFGFAFTTDVNNNGITHLNDLLCNFQNIYAYGGSFGFDRNNPGVFGDDYRLIRTGSGDSNIIYKLDNGITEFSADTFFVIDESNIIDGSIVVDESLIQFYVSPNGTDWTLVSSPVIDNAGLSYNFYKRIYKFYNINPTNKYLKIELPDKGVISPMLTNVRINMIDKNSGLFEGRPAATFYVDAENGNDANSGLLPSEALKSLESINCKYLQAGDKVLFKSGQTFNGWLTLNGCGSKENPITIGVYGGSEKAKIKAYSGTAITVTAEHMVIENLEVTNPNGTAGIFLTTSGKGKKSDITIKDCYIHDIDINEQQFAYQSGAIVVFVDTPEIAWIEDIVIENNIIENVARVGIFLGSNWAGRPGMGGKNAYVSDNEGWYPIANCIVRGNEVTDARGDGIMAVGAANLLIEKNSVNNAFCTTKQSGVACVAVWTANTNDVVMQYNDVGFTNLPTGNADGDAFDIDIASLRTTVQYNYSHDNASGFLLMCNFGEGYKISRDHIVRFNLSVNDVASAGQGVFMLVGENPNTHIYNNTIYIGGSYRSVMPVYHFGDATSNFTFTNNIFAGKLLMNYSWGNTGADFVNFKYDKNVFYNVGTPKNNGVTVTNAINKNPSFTNADISTQSSLSSIIAAFTPKTKISGAAVIANNGGKDIAGNSVSDKAFFGCIAY